MTLLHRTPGVQPGVGTGSAVLKEAKTIHNFTEIAVMQTRNGNYPGEVWGVWLLSCAVSGGQELSEGTLYISPERS